MCRSLCVEGYSFICLLSLPVPDDCTALRTRGLNLSLSCISVCVNQLLESTHLITDKGGGHIPDDEYKSNKHTDTKDF